MKTKEELNAIKEKVEALNKKLAELSEDELKEVTGGGLEYIGPANLYGSVRPAVVGHNMPQPDEKERYVMQTFVVPDGGGQDKQYEPHIYKDLV